MIGTSGFQGGRLREARESRGLSVAEFAERVCLTKQMVNLYERGKHSPAPETFVTICDTLRFPKQFFVRPPAPRPVTPVFYRSLKSATRLMRDRAERLYGWFQQLTAFISRYVELPVTNAPSLNLPTDPALITDTMIDEAATQVRRHWNLGDGVISNVVLLLENHGIITTRYTFGATQLDAFSNWDLSDLRPYVVLGADKLSQVRSRFDAAHELAHIVLHRHIPRDLLLVPEAFTRIEEQAHRFARAFLLPASTFGEEYVPPSIDALVELKARWRVSIGVIIARANELGLLSKDQVRRLWINRNRRGWGKREPFDDDWQPELPVLIRRSLEMLNQAGILRPTAISKALALNIDDIESVVGLPAGTLQSDDTESVGEPQPKLLDSHGD